jgi:hypothetical protein
MDYSELKGELLEIAGQQTKAEASLFANGNVTGVGIGPKIKNGVETGDMSLKVFVASKLDKSMLSESELIPAKVGKFHTDVVETGIITAGSLLANGTRQRPAKGGLSVGHFKITAGTLGCNVKDVNPRVGITERYYILSNNHVLAASNAATIGDPILQPGPYDGGTVPNDIIAHLTRFVPIQFGPDGRNLVDCAIAEGDFADLDREIYWVGYVNGIAAVQPRDIVSKTGRTTGHTTGYVTSVNATINVNYGAAGTARFVNQITTTNMARGGDSGSLLVDKANHAVGLLFAGSSTITIYNPIKPVMGMLGIKFL